MKLPLSWTYVVDVSSLKNWYWLDRGKPCSKNQEVLMAFEEIKAEIGLLFEQMVNQPQDVHEIRETIREKLRLLRATGMPVPQDLVELEKRIEQDFDT